MRAFRVVAVYVLEATKAQFILIAERLSIDAFTFHMAEEAFTTGIVIWIPFLGEGLNSIAFLQRLTEGKSGIFRALI